jgi:hypothetical protein
LGMLMLRHTPSRVSDLPTLLHVGESFRCWDSKEYSVLVKHASSSVPSQSSVTVGTAATAGVYT